MIANLISALRPVSGAPRLATLPANAALLSPSQATTAVLSASGARGAILSGHARLAVAQTIPRASAGTPTVIAANTIITAATRLATPGTAVVHQNALLTAAQVRVMRQFSSGTESRKVGAFLSIYLEVTSSNPITSHSD